MNYGLYTSASGMFASLHRMDTAANNLANSETIGFKPDVASLMARDVVRREDGVGNLPSDQILERLGAGVFIAPTRTDFSQGIVENSGNDLDVALKGEGFFLVRGEDGEPRLTRDGRMARSKDGMIVQASSGLPYLSENRFPIKLEGSAPIEIDTTGGIRQGPDYAGRMAVVLPTDPNALRKEGQGLWRLDAGVDAPASAAQVIQRSIERSGSDAVSAMLEISSAERAAGSNAKMITLYDELSTRSITTFGRMA